MNKRKIALFVEGDTELIFVRSFLNVWYNYDANLLGVECYKLQANQPHPVPYPIGSRDSENFYQIIIVGNDNIMSKMLERAESLGNAGFSLVVGLRDMFCDAYHKKSVHGRVVSPDLNARFIASAREVINNCGLSNSSDIQIHYAIMEVETWLLGMSNILTLIDSNLTKEDVVRQIGIDLSQDPETTIYHPAVELKKLFDLTGGQYDKHTDETEKIISQLIKEDYETLYHSGKCESFHRFVDAIV